MALFKCLDRLSTRTHRIGRFPAELQHAEKDLLVRRIIPLRIVICAALIQTQGRGMARRELWDDQWTHIKDLLPGKSSDPGRTATDNRKFVDAVLWIARTGAHWRELPESFGAWNSVFQRYNPVVERGRLGARVSCSVRRSRL